MSFELLCCWPKLIKFLQHISKFNIFIIKFTNELVKDPNNQFLIFT
jgi:hypothetical protein